MVARQAVKIAIFHLVVRSPFILMGRLPASPVSLPRKRWQTLEDDSHIFCVSRSKAHL